jgi:hypothetical protein
MNNKPVGYYIFVAQFEMGFDVHFKDLVEKEDKANYQD